MVCFFKFNKKSISGILPKELFIIDTLQLCLGNGIQELIILNFMSFRLHGIFGSTHSYKVEPPVPFIGEFTLAFQHNGLSETVFIRKVSNLYRRAA